MPSALHTAGPLRGVPPMTLDAGPLLEEMYASSWWPPSQSTSMPKAGPLLEEMYGRGGNGAA